VKWGVLDPSPLGYSIETGEGERFGSGQARQRERLSHRPTPGAVTGKGHVDHAWPIELGELDAAHKYDPPPVSASLVTPFGVFLNNAVASFQQVA